MVRTSYQHGGWADKVKVPQLLQNETPLSTSMNDTSMNYARTGANIMRVIAMY